MNMFRVSALKGLACSASALALVMAGPVLAQTTTDATGDPVDEADGECAADATGAPIATDPDCATTAPDGTVDAPASGGGIVVTGSRIKRDTYTSISPLQVIVADDEEAAGLFDPAQILQRSTAASGTQIDATFQGFVLDNGPGSQTIDLRGLGADRTLLLLNGRRLAPAGVEGAPSAPSINLLPGSLIERYDLLLDGASSVYGSDAIAGVGNVVLRKDFDGLELYARGEINPYGAGEDYTVSAAWGKNFDRGFFGIGAEYDYRDAIRLKDRKFFEGCDTEYEETSTGEIRTVGISNDAIVRSRTNGTIGFGQESCKQSIGAGVIQVLSIYDSALFYQPTGGTVGVPGGNSGIPNYSVLTNAFGAFVDADNNGIADVNYADYNLLGLNPEQTFIPEQKRYNVMAYGEWTFPGAMNLTPFFEANFSRAEINSTNNGIANLFPNVPGVNPFNPCNINNLDCGRQQNLKYGLSNIPSLRLQEGISRTAQPFLPIRDDRNNIEITQDQYRGVLGVRGDLPFISPSWTFELSGVYSRSEGRSIRRGIREDKLAFALGIDPTADFGTDGIFDNDGDGIADDYNIGDTTPPLLGGPNGGACNAAGLRNPGAALPDLLQGCVPVNLFAPSLLGGRPFGEFATTAERDYLFGVRQFDTTYEQTLLSLFATGDVFTLPAGPVGAVVGVEYRVDSIDSRPDVITSNGLFFSSNSDKGAVGSKWIREAFAELDFPLQANKPWVRELNLNLSGRVTDEEFYGTNYTYAIKGNWRPADPLVFKFSYGTSFRAPNLRENFLAGQTGFFTVLDPCAVPSAAYNALAPIGTPKYNPALDTRAPEVFANCIREGRDPLRVGIDPAGIAADQTADVLTLSGGSLDINPETSRSITAGFAFEETFGAGWDVSLGFNYYDIKLKDSIVEPSSQFIANDCFTRSDGTRSPFCDRLQYDTDPLNSSLLISDIDSGFLNLDQEAARGIDLNATFGKELIAFKRTIDFGLNLRANHLIERSTLFIDDNGDPSVAEYQGEFGFPKWTGFATFTADVDNFRFTWQTRYVGPVKQDEAGLDPFSDAFGRGPDGKPTGTTGNTCLGGGSGTYNATTGVFTPNNIVKGDGVFCRDIGYADEYFTHSASLRYQTDRYTFLVGVDNIFNVAPPLVDNTEVFSIANTAIGNGYDYDGREFFASVEVKF